jgi:MFS family permease
MQDYKRLNNILGWMVFVIASAVYILTSEPTMSYWDCGEYISTSYKLEVGHAPGAPLFQILGRFFSLFAFGNLALVARMVNTMSALSSAFTILFLFWSITMLARKIVQGNGEMDRSKMYTVFAAGLVGSLAYTFTDSFWFSAVEGEVYAMSSFFTAVVFWAMLKWEEHAGETHNLRWLILIAYLVGLSIGVHMLNLLTIPAMTMIWYFKKYSNPNWKGILLALVVSVLILGLVMSVIIPWVLKLAAWFELFSVNSLKLPFNAGTVIFFVLLIGGIVLGLHYTRKKLQPAWNAVILAFIFILVGYSSFLLLVIRSNADTPIDENNPENAMYLLAYLQREQYGDWPILNGPYYNAPVIAHEDGNPVYKKDSKTGKYEITDKREKVIPVYDPRFTTVFPRMWSNREGRHISEYKKWGNVKGVPVEIQTQSGNETRMKPTFIENLAFMWNYQFVHMYYRYFMWNFAGRQNDNQGMGSKIEGNWKSGIGFWDKWRLGNQDLPEGRKSKADNSFYFLPLLLGLLGAWFTFRKDYKTFIVVGLLFVMTGLAILVYLNQYSPQPRERDYAYAGSFYAFAIWIGFGVIWISSKLARWLKPGLSVALASLFGMITVGVMAQQGWDDHDRSGRYTALAMAENYLNSCAPNAILFTNGDNDTFPLWYAQEVEGIRTDVRVVNLSLLNTDWYIDQMKRKAYDSDAVPFSMTQLTYRQGNHDVTYLFDDPQFKDRYIDIRQIFDIINTDESKLKMKPGTSDPEIDFFPGKKFVLPSDSAALIANGAVPAKYRGQITDLVWEIKRDAIEKASLMILDLIAHNDWKRPVYFVATTGTDAYIGLERYFHQEGLAYRLLPVPAKAQDGEIGGVNVDALYDNVMNRFKSGGLNDPSVYLDETNLRMVMNIRSVYARLVTSLIEQGKKDSARKVIDKCLAEMPDNCTPYDYFIVPVVDGLYKIGETSRANAIAEKLIRTSSGELAYYFSFPDMDLKDMEIPMQESLFTLQKIGVCTGLAGETKLSKQADEALTRYYDLYMNKVYQRQ